MPLEVVYHSKIKKGEYMKSRKKIIVFLFLIIALFCIRLYIDHNLIKIMP